MRFERTVRGLESAVLQRAHHRGADGDNAAAFADGAIDGISGGRGERVTLTVKVNLINSLHAERRKGAEAYVECETRDFDATNSERIEDLRGEMEAGSGRRYRAPLAGEDGLVAFAIRRLVVAMDVGRQGYMADAVEDGEEIVHRLEAQQALAELAALDDFGFKRDAAGRIGENEDLADGYLSAWTDKGAPEVFARCRFGVVVSHPFR
jgi:hypothetical protein